MRATKHDQHLTKECGVAVMSVRLQKSSKSLFIELLLVKFQFMTGIKRRVKIRVWITASDRVERVSHSTSKYNYFLLYSMQMSSMSIHSIHKTGKKKKLHLYYMQTYRTYVLGPQVDIDRKWEKTFNLWLERSIYQIHQLTFGHF